MTSRRLLKAAEAIREVVSMAILTELRDPRVENVTVVSVEVLPDMKQARVFVTVMGEAKRQQLALRGLQNAAGFLQRKVADRIETRYTPRLEFVLDSGVKNALEIDRILRRVLPKQPPSDTDATAAEEPVEAIAAGDEAADSSNAAGESDASPNDAHPKFADPIDDE